MLFWQAGGGARIASLTGASDKLPISAARFWSLNFAIFYAYYIVCVGLFALFWFIYSPHRWQYWSILGTALIIFVTWFLVEVGVAINAWYAPFYDLIQQALSAPHKVKIEQFYHEIGVFLGIAFIAVVVSVLNNFFVSHYVFRWRTAMNEYYMANWQQLRHIEGAAQRVQEDTMRFASTVESMGVSLLNAVMTLIAFLPVLVALSVHVPELPIVGHIPYGLVIAAIVWSIVGTGILAIVGIKLPGWSLTISVSKRPTVKNWYLVRMILLAPHHRQCVSCLARCGKTIFASIFTICTSILHEFCICNSIMFSACSCCFRRLFLPPLRWAY